MNALLLSLINDPIFAAAGLVFLGTFIVLLWAARAWHHATRSDELAAVDDDEDTAPEPAASDRSGLMEARLQEIAGQLAEISRKIASLEKNLPDKTSANETQNLSVTGMTPVIKQELDRLAQYLDTRITSLTAAPPSVVPEELRRIEAKLEGIHKLLIILTDGNSTPEQS